MKTCIKQLLYVTDLITYKKEYLLNLEMKNRTIITCGNCGKIMNFCAITKNTLNKDLFFELNSTFQNYHVVKRQRVQ